VLGEFALVPFVVGAVHPEQVAQAIDRLWGGDETLIVVSSDLSHYLTYDTASAIDAGTAQAITSFDASITHEQACGATPLAGALLVAKRHGLAPRQLDVRNSGDTAGGKSRVVGYGSFSFGQTPVEYGEHHGRVLLGIARQAVVAAVGQGAAPQDVAAEAWLREIRATFVTIKARGELRGCVGTLEPARPLGQDVAANARAAVTIDRRFQPLGPADLDGLQVEVSVLSRPSRLVFEDHAGLIAQLEPGTDGLILEHGEGASTKRGTFLPQVWDSLPEPETFVAELKRKAGLPSSTRTTACAIKRYRVRKWRESEMKDEEPAQVT
jgi:AmmeMemoRadiSam system protein A